MRSIALDVHRSFCEVAIAEDGEVRHAGRIETRPLVIEQFARSLAPDDQVVLEATGGAIEIASILRPHVACRGRQRRRGEGDLTCAGEVRSLRRRDARAAALG